MKFLIVVDMQNDFIDGSLGTEEAKKIVEPVVEKINNFDGYVVATQDTHSDMTYLNSQEGKYLPVEHCIDSTHGWELHPLVRAAMSERSDTRAIRKSTFGSTRLPDTIKIASNLTTPDEIELVGLCTDVCVISNAIILKTVFPETKITIDASCCAGVTPESHNRALKTMQGLQMDIINWEE